MSKQNKRFDYGEHDGIVAPYTAVHQGIAAMLQWPEITWCRCGRETNGHHALEAIGLVVTVVRCLENKDLAVFALKSRDTKTHLGIAKQPVAQLVGQHAFQRGAIVKVASVVLLIPNPCFQAAERRVCEERKDLASSGDVKVEKVGCCVSGTQAQGEDSACRGACNKVEAGRTDCAVMFMTTRAAEPRAWRPGDSRGPKVHSRQRVQRSRIYSVQAGLRLRDGQG